MPVPQAAPSPILCPAHQVRPQGVALDIAANGQEMVFCLNRERLESSLVNVSGAMAVPMGVPPLCVRERKPSDKPRQFTVRVRLDHEVPMIGHQAPGEKIGAKAIDCLLENSLQSLVICVALENREAGIATVENVVNHPSIRGSLRSAHGMDRSRQQFASQEKGS
jgi:hypothetical protein